MKLFCVFIELLRLYADLMVNRNVSNIYLIDANGTSKNIGK